MLKLLNVFFKNKWKQLLNLSLIEIFSILSIFFYIYMNKKIIKLKYLISENEFKLAYFLNYLMVDKYFLKEVM